MHYIRTLPHCTISYILSPLFHIVHYLTLYPYSSSLYIILNYIPTLPYCTLSTLYPYSSVLYTILYSISTLPHCTLSYILSLLLHTVHFLTFYLYSFILYTILHYISTLPYCTLSYNISLSKEEKSLNVRLCREWKSGDRMQNSVQYGRVRI
jgi:hypothetical protein